MKRKAVATEYKYRDARYEHHSGPIEKLQRADKCSFTADVYVNVKRYNGIVLRRQIRLASYVGAPILRKKAQFSNPPVVTE